MLTGWSSVTGVTVPVALRREEVRNYCRHMDFRSDSVAAVAERVRSGEQPAREVVETALARIDAVDGVINAFTSIDSERALVAADAIDAAVRDGRDPGTLAGVPIGANCAYRREVFSRYRYDPRLGPNRRSGLRGGRTPIRAYPRKPAQ